MDMLHLADFHFLRPLWLVAIIPLLLLVAAIAHLHKQQSGWQSVLAGHLYSHLVTSENTSRTKPPLYLLAVGWLLATLAIAGPTWERLPQPVYQLHSGKVVVIDMSLSMRATDVKPNRLARARYKAIDLVNAIAEGETGLIAYAGDAFTISPLSSDAQNLTTLIPSLTPEIMPVEGSEPYLGLLAAIELLTNAGYQQGEIFWITDGIENNQVNEVNKLLRNTPFRLSILAVGTEEGAPIQLTNGDFLKDSRGAIVLPKLSVSNLRTLAKTGRGRYIAMSADDEDIDYLKNQSLLERQSEQEDEQSADNFGDKWKEMGPYLLLLMLPLAAYGFRRGMVSLFLLSMLTPLYSPTADANGLTDLWKTGDQQGQQAMAQQDFAGAAEAFDDPLWRGTAYYKNQDYQQALEAFRQSDSTDALYNQGNALAQLGELEQAMATYDKVLAKDPTHEDARANKALLEQQQKEQQEKDKQQGDDSGDSQDGQGESQEQEQSSPGESSPGEDSAGEKSPPQDQTDDSQSGRDKQGQPNEPPTENADKDKEQEGDSESSQQTEQPVDPETQEGQQVAQPAQLTDQEKEQMQRMQTLLNKVPDDPAFLLKRKMQIESQQRKRQRMPTQLQRNW
ncbi:MAG: Ca-activated chloride channel family protein [Paraglaciecola sp.]|jgi:Ca-activated chloride channel family protein